MSSLVSDEMLKKEGNCLGCRLHLLSVYTTNERFFPNRKIRNLLQYNTFCLFSTLQFMNGIYVIFSQLFLGTVEHEMGRARVCPPPAPTEMDTQKPTLKYTHMN